MITIVAEIGCNHNGDINLAKRMIEEAKKCGVDAVKFQTFKADKLISKNAPKAIYQINNTGEEESQLEMTKKLELSQDDFILLSDYAKSLGLITFSTPFDLESIEFLEKTKQNIWKIPSGEITNLPYLEKIGSIKIEAKKIILSTGMSTIEEIKTAVNVLISSGTKNEQIIILHCNTEYPTLDEDVNISAINDLKKHFPNNKIGFSDHSIGYTAAIGASVLGICMIEKHFTLDKNLPGPDHKASATPDELKMLCDNVRRIEKMYGNDKKIVTKSEKRNMIVARKSIVAKVNIKKGDIFNIDNLTCKRPGNGISPMMWYEVLGKTAEKNFDIDDLIEIKGIENQNNE